MSFIKKISQTNLFKIASLNSLSIVLKLGIGLITSKVIAVFVGPSGLALVGNFRNFVGTFETISTLGFQNGVVKYIAETKEKELEFKRYVATVCITVATVSVVLSGLLFFFSAHWNTLIFGSHLDYSFVFKAFAFALPWYALSLVLVSIMNGLGKFKHVIYINTIGNCIGLVVSVGFIYHYQTFGALLATIITPSLLFLVSFYYVNKDFSLLAHIRFDLFDFKIIKNLSHYFLMAFVSGIVGSLVFLAVRKNIITIVGIQQAGYWEAMTRISSYYLLFVSSILTLYFLPKLVTSQNKQATKKVFWVYYKTIFPFIILGLLLLYLSRFLIVKILFTKDFLPVTSLFFWQLLGDLFKMASWILGYNFFAKKLTLAFIVTELFSLSITYFSSIFLIKIYGIQGVVMAYAFTYLIYLLVLSVYFRKSLF
ncbi:O-antigen translocase [Flavobacterium restrictum]|uniref:O-antigen translocase n=1 Tax=Flavobacterium restrictum TaxID=2594428 RepID=A0A553EBJ4_9FLAO|nr:O-antigen translocase [Flavobacterium restrictum]TRX42153.1 O-antigen translocase [Flavobacterium restrictum]